MRVSDEDLLIVKGSLDANTLAGDAFERTVAELLVLRQVADAASLLEDAMAGIPCPCREKACEAMCRTLREAGR